MSSWLARWWRTRPEAAIVGSTVFGPATVISGVGGDVVVNQQAQPLYHLDTGVPAPRAFTVAEAREQPSLLLNAQHEQVEFVGRAALLDQLRQWRDAPRPAASVLLLHGPGGQGKSRLAARFARAAEGAGWTVLHVRQSDGLRVGKGEPPPGTGGRGVLLVVDYAERWPVPDLITFLQDCGHQTLPVRVLLVARPSGWWWSRLAQRIKRLDITAAAVAVPALTRDVGRDVLFAGARDAFARALDVPGAERIPVPAEPVGGGDATVLAVHMAALAAVDSLRLGTAAPRHGEEVSAYLLGREYEHWERLAERRRSRVTGEALAQAVFTATLTGALPYTQGLTALDRVSIGTAEHNDQVLKDHAVAYPPAHPELVLEPLYPDRLGEDFIALMIPGASADVSLSDPWAVGAVTRLLSGSGETDGPGGGRGDGLGPPDSGGAAQGPAWARRTIGTLVETAKRWDHVATVVLSPLLSEHPDLMRSAGPVALAGLARIPALPPATLHVFERGLAWRDADTDAGAAELALQLHDGRMSSASDGTERVELLNHLATRLHHAGRYGDALAPMEAALRITQQQVDTGAAPRERLASHLDLAGILYDMTDQDEKALAASREAVDHYRLLATTGDRRLRAKLSYALANLGARGQDAEARRAAAQEGADIARELTADPSAADQGELAGSLHNLGNALLSLGRHEEARAALSEAVALRRTQAQVNFGYYAVHLPPVLMAYAAVLARCDRMAQAVRVLEERAGVLRRLARSNPAAYDAQLAQAEAALDRLTRDRERSP